jgi:dTDP-glucose 4,6-dehydratase
MTYHRLRGLNAGIARIFNTYGPRMRADDGRVIPTLIRQALAGEPLTVFGDGRQTRSFCYVDDMVRGLAAMAQSGETGPVNLGNPDEVTILEAARLIIEITGSASEIAHSPLSADDPKRRRPDITRARELLGWEPKVPLREGLARTIGYFRDLAAQAG